MLWFEIVELSCSIISALSLIVSVFAFIILYFKKIEITVELNNNLISVYGCALKHQMIAVRIEIFNNDNSIDKSGFFAGGDVTKTLNAQEYTLLKCIPLSNEPINRIKVKIKFIKYGTKIYKCKVRGNTKDVCGS